MDTDTKAFIAAVIGLVLVFSLMVWSQLSRPKCLRWKTETVWVSESMWMMPIPDGNGGFNYFPQFESAHWSTRQVCGLWNNDPSLTETK